MQFNNTINLKPISVYVRSTVIFYITQIIYFNIHFIPENLSLITAVYTT